MKKEKKEISKHLTGQKKDEQKVNKKDSGFSRVLNKLKKAFWEEEILITIFKLLTPRLIRKSSRIINVTRKKTK